MQRGLAGLGLEMLRTRTLNSYLTRYADACVEVDGCFRQLIFPDLPARQDRARLLANLQGTGLCEAMWLLRHLHQSLSVAGDLCEFGVAQGATSALLANEIRDTPKALWLFDSFQGLPKPTPEDTLLDDIYSLGAMERYAGQMAEAPAQVLGRLRDINFPLARTRVVAGFIEATVQQAGLPDSVCFAYVDFDFYAPIKTALEFLDTRLTVGGYVIVDDYGHFSTGARTAVDEFVAARPGRWTLTLPPDFAGHFAILKREPREASVNNATSDT